MSTGREADLPPSGVAPLASHSGKDIIVGT